MKSLIKVSSRPAAQIARGAIPLLFLPMLAAINPAAAESAGGIGWTGAISVASPSWSNASGGGAGSAACAAAIAAAESRYGLPAGLMAAIGAVESGRFDAGSQAVIAWPWSINAEGAGQQFDSKQLAVAEVAALQAGGMQSIDVGCMQVNLRWHPDAFATLNDAFDPTLNADYSARLLNRLYDRHGDWRTAVGYYHSPTDWRQANYTTKVAEAWATRGGSFAGLPVAMVAETAPAQPGAPAPFGGLTAAVGSGMPSSTAAAAGPGADLGPSAALVTAARTITYQGGTASQGELRFFPLPPR